MTRIDQLRQKHKAAFEERGVRLTYMPFILKAVVDALKAFPVLNASIDGDNIVYHKDINLGVAVALDWGLIVPVIHHADEKNVLGLARAVERPRRPRAREEAQGRGGPGRHLHRHEPRRLRQPLRHADHQPAAGRASSASARSRSGRWCATTPSPSAPCATSPDLRPPPGGRRRRRPLHGAGQEDAAGVRRSCPLARPFGADRRIPHRSAVRTSSRRQVLARGDRRSPVVTRIDPTVRPDTPSTDGDHGEGDGVGSRGRVPERRCRAMASRP